MEQLDTGVIKIKPTAIDMSKKGSMREARDIVRVGHRAISGDPDAFDQMLDIFITHSTIEAPSIERKVRESIGPDAPEAAYKEAYHAALHEALFDELSVKDAEAIMQTISGQGASVPPRKGG